MSRRDSAVRLALLAPELLGTYGDNGNAIVLERRLAWRGVPVELVRVEGGAPVPESCDLYLLGGGEDRPQVLACEELASSPALAHAPERGAVVFGVCAGFQLLGRTFPGADGEQRPGLGLLDTSTRKGSGPRAVGEVVVEVAPALGLPPLTGFENHGGVTTLGDGVQPLGTVVAGIGNGGGADDEGAVAGRVLGTYLHGPVLARNPALADHLLALVVGPLGPLDDAEVERLRAERLRAATRPRRTWGRR